MAETANQVDSLIAETFTLVLTPHQEPGTADIVWNTTRATATGPVAERVAKKLATEEKLIQTYGGVRVKMDIDRYQLWTDRHDIGIRDLWNTYARYPHLPRLTSYQTLAGAISDGTSNMNWVNETFAYAEAHDGDTWVGIRKNEHVNPSPGGFLVHPQHLPEPAVSVDASDDNQEDGETVAGGGSSTSKKAAGGGTTPSLPTHFYALFDLDSVRGIKQLGEILEHVANRLGSDVELSLEVRSANSAGYDDATRRVVSENATNLGAKSSEFE